MKLADLVRDDATGGMSSTKLWSHVGNAAMTFAFLKIAWLAQPSDGLAMLFLTYGGLVAASQFASKLVGLKWGAPANGNGAPK